jgi:phosphatidylinositol alpha-1,6-mannosyltransferase
MLRDLLVVTELFPPAIGGSGEFLANVYSRLDGRAVRVLTEGHSADVERRGRFEIHRAPFKSDMWSLLHPHGFLRYVTLARKIRALAPSGTMVHCARALPEGVSAWLARLMGGPRFMCWAHGEEINIAGSSRELRVLARRVYQAADFVLANSENTRLLLLGLGVPSARVHVVRPGVDPARFRPDVDARALRSSLSPNGELVLLSVGRLQRRKGHDHVIAALERIAAVIQPFRYVIVGDGEERARLESAAADAGLRDQVKFVGNVRDQDLPSYYAACDIFMMPNQIDGIDLEGFGIVFLEAAAAEKPVIGGASGGVAEAVEHDVTGLLVQGGDLDELGTAIQRLASSVELRQKMGRAGRARVIRGFTWERGAAELDAILAERCGAT